MGAVLCGDLDFTLRAGSCMDNLVQSQAEDRRRFQRPSVSHSIPERGGGRGASVSRFEGRGKKAGRTFYLVGRPARLVRWS